VNKERTAWSLPGIATFVALLVAAILLVGLMIWYITQVLVPEAYVAIGHHRLRHDANAALGVPAHVTVLYPFRSPLDAATAEQAAQLCRGFAPFEARFSSVGRFPAAERFPDLPPYGGTIPDPIPHLTVAEGVSPEIADELSTAVGPALPLTTFVTELALLVQDDTGRWSVGRGWPLG
jgi:hypothetical protein